MCLVTTMLHMNYSLAQAVDQALVFLWAVLIVFNALKLASRYDRNCHSCFYSWYSFSHF